MHRLIFVAGLALCLVACNNDRPVTGDTGQPPDLRPPDTAAVDGESEQGCITPPEMRIPDLSADAPVDARPVDTVPDRLIPPDAPVSDALPEAAPDLPVSDGSVSDGSVSDGPVPDAQVPDSVSGPCLAGMVLVGGSYCMDRYEASRVDATWSYQGTMTTKAVSQPNVIPWYSISLSMAEAKQACAAAGKRLCTLAEWKLACSGPTNQVYAYGNTYDPIKCNGIDTFCLCGSGQPCDGVYPCPYPHCFNQPPPGGGPPAYCGAWFHPVPTGGFFPCVNADGIYDLNGNVWELIDSTDGLNHFRGGAYNCGDSETLHRCDYDATWGPSAQGFRCCADPLPGP